MEGRALGAGAEAIAYAYLHIKGGWFHAELKRKRSLSRGGGDDQPGSRTINLELKRCDPVGTGDVQGLRG